MRVKYYRILLISFILVCLVPSTVSYFVIGHHAVQTYDGSQIVDNAQVEVIDDLVSHNLTVIDKEVNWGYMDHWERWYVNNNSNILGEPYQGFLTAALENNAIIYWQRINLGNLAQLNFAFKTNTTVYSILFQLEYYDTWITWFDPPTALAIVLWAASVALVVVLIGIEIKKLRVRS